MFCVLNVRAIKDYHQVRSVWHWVPKVSLLFTFFKQGGHEVTLVQYVDQRFIDARQKALHDKDEFPPPPP